MSLATKRDPVVARDPAPSVSGLIPLVGIVALAAALYRWDIVAALGAAARQGPAAIVPPYWQMTASALGGHLWRLAALAWLFVVFCGCGGALARLLGLRFTNRWERLSFGFGLGAGAWAQLFFLLGLAGLLHRALLLTLLALGVLPALWRSKDDSEASGSSWLQALKSDGAAQAFGWLFIFNIALLLPYALVPETFYDSLEYHLGLPHLYLLEHAIRATPSNAFSGMPSIPAMLFGWTLTIDPLGILAHLLSFSMLAWTAAALFGLAQRLGRAAAGVVAAAVFALTPVVMYIGGLTTVELTWGFYQLLCFPALLSAVESPKGSPQRRGWIIASGLCLGLAMATKYLAWTLPFAFLVFLFGLNGPKTTERGSPRELLAAWGVAGLMLAPWVLRNVAFYHNPIYPFLQGVFAPASALEPGWRYLGTGTSYSWGAGILGFLREYVTAPWSMAFAGNPAESLGPVLPALLLLLPCVRLEARERLLGWYALGCWLPLSLAVRFPRYFIACLPLLSLLAALALARIEAPRLKKAFAACLALALLAVGISYWSLMAPRTRWAVFTGRTDAAQFLSHKDEFSYPAPYYAAAEFLDREAPADARILVFGDSRGFYLPRDFIASTPLQATTLERWANDAESGKQLKARMDAERVTYVLVNHAEIVRQGLALHFSPAGKRSLDEFWRRYTLKVFQVGPEGESVGGKTILDRWVVVYRVLSEEEAAKPHPAEDLFAAYNVSNGRQ